MGRNDRQGTDESSGKKEVGEVRREVGGKGNGGGDRIEHEKREEERNCG